ncbi:hypothetical protein N9Q68_02015 [Polaribacter sp.]|nr:hypothetical protein [Polaribacter sp.]
MKKLTIIIIFLFVGTISAQTKYQNGMRKALSLWEKGELNKASQLFERISKAEPEKWLPPFYAAKVEILGSFGLKEEIKLKNKLTKAQELLDLAKSNSKNNPEILITQALLNTGYIAFDGQKYGMILSGKTTQLYTKALELSPENPRVILGNAEWNIGSARFFGKTTTPYCKEIERAIKLGKEESIEKEFYPKFKAQRAKQVLNQCRK